MASSPSKGKASGLSPTTPGSPPRPTKSLTAPATPESPRPRLVYSRTQTYIPTNSLSVPGTPYLTPHVSSVNVVTGQSKRLLMPTVRSVKSTVPSSPRLPPTKTSPSRLGRSRAGSASLADATEHVSIGASDWFVGGEKFETVDEKIDLEGFQIYAVEKWVVARKRPVLVLTVFTGDPSHKATVTAFSPQASLSPAEAQQAWDDAVRNLRRDGTRPKETDKGVVMVTSLANFRSDYTIVHVPSGNFLDIREQLHTNINLLRMGCGGRSALTLEEPSDATKDRFIAMYHFADKAPARLSELFNATVLELVKLIQAALAIFGLFDLWVEERNGLLCDLTCEGIQRWVTEVGEPFLHVEPTERVADPTVLAALFSLILSTRSKLHALNIVAPKDPFLDPNGFVTALAVFHSSKSAAHSSHQHIFSLPNSPTGTVQHSPPAPNAGPNVIFLTPALIDFIQSHYEKSRQSESYKVHRVLKSKLDDLATDLRTHGTENAGTTATTIQVTSDLAAFARCAVTTRDAPQSLRYLWTGRPGQAAKKRREKEVVWSDGERDGEDKDRDRDGEKGGTGRDGRERDERDKERDREARSGDEGDRLWSGRVQRKIESWAGLGKGKKLSVDFGTLGKAFMPESPRGPSEKSGQSSMVPSVVVSRDPADEEEFLSSGQQSPTSDTPHPLMLGVGSLPNAERSASELSEYDRRVTEFNQKRPYTKMQSRIISWSDARSARGILHENGSKETRVGASPLGKTDSTTSSQREYDGASMVDISDLEKLHQRRLLALGADRRRSFDDAPEFASSHVLPVERMRIDVELCGQLLVMRRREAHLANVVACLQALTAELSAQNSRLHGEHEGTRGALGALDARTGELHRLEALRTEADALTQETNALAYESAQFLVDDLWHMAAQPRQRVFALREKVFGTGRRLPQGVRGAHGRFSRVQWTLDGRERLVDRMGRTESDAEEEEELQHHLAGVETEDEEEIDVVEHQNLKPTWLLRFFNYWGGRLGLSRTQEPPAVPGAVSKNDKNIHGQDGKLKLSKQLEDSAFLDGGTSSSIRLPSDDPRSQFLQRTFTT